MTQKNFERQHPKTARSKRGHNPDAKQTFDFGGQREEIVRLPSEKQEVINLRNKFIAWLHRREAQN
jgi:hypothetical protein